MPAPLPEHQPGPPTADARIAPTARRPLIAAAVAALAVLLAFSLASSDEGPQGGPVRVYRFDWLDTDGQWHVWTWALGTPPNPNAQMQTEKRACRRRSDTHACRGGTVARSDTEQAARTYQQTACRNHTTDTGRSPAGMATCG